MDKAAAISLGHCPGGGKRRKGRVNISTNAKRKTVNSSGENCCMPFAPETILNAHNRQIAVNIIRSRSFIKSFSLPNPGYKWVEQAIVKTNAVNNYRKRLL